MLKKFIKLSLLFSIFPFANSSFIPVQTADCEEHLSRPGANKAKEMARQRKAKRNLEIQTRLNQN